MPLPLIPIMLRLSAVAIVGYVLKRTVSKRTHAGRIDQRTEDALDDLDEGLAVNRPLDRLNTDTRQTNTALRIKRVLRWGKSGIEIDAAILSRFRVRRL